MQDSDPAVITRQVSELGINNGPSNPSAMAGFELEPPPTPQLHHRGVIATDITMQFIDAAQKLPLGELVKDPFFTLFESVGALEIMDRKMDSGYLEPGESMEDEYDFNQALLPEDVLGIIDQLLLHEVAWHMGYPLSQTIFTSLYIDRMLSPTPMSLDQTYFERHEGHSHDETLCHQILRAYCLGLIKTCFFVNNRIKSEHYYEEEDFVTHTYHRNMLEEIDSDVIHRLLEETVKILSSNSDFSPEVTQALSCRLKFRAMFLAAVDAADSRTSSEVRVFWEKMLACIPELKLSLTLGKPVPASFSVKLQRKLASTVPPRPIVEVSQDAAYDHLERLCRNGSAVIEVLKYDTSYSLMAFVSLFQAQKPQPSVYIRTLIQHYFFGDMVILGNMSIRQILNDDLATVVLPADKLLDRVNDEVEIPSHPRFQMATKMEIFRSRAAVSYLNLLRTICQNRCRMRRSLCHSIVDWDNLQLDAEELDHDLRTYTKEQPIMERSIAVEPIFSFPLSSWAYFHKLRQMEWIVQMGFELQVYQPDELAGMYWYLHYLSKTRSRHLERIKCFVSRSYTAFQHGSGTTAEKQAECINAKSFLNLQMLDATSTYGFADALSCLFTVLGRLSLISNQPRPYSNDAMRYQVRMKPFLAVGLPEVVSFEEFTYQVTQPEESSLGLLKFATQSIASAKRGLEALSKLNARDAFCNGSHDSWVKNVKDCLKACIFTGVTIAAAKKAVEDLNKGKKMNIKVEIPPTGKGYHDWWIVPKVVAAP